MRVLLVLLAAVAAMIIPTFAAADTGAEATGTPFACKFAEVTFDATCTDGSAITNEDGSASAVWGDGILSLTKDAPTSALLVAGAEVNGFADDPLFQLGFDVRGYCGNGSPRFNVYEGDATHFFGCALGEQTDLGDGWTHVEFTCTEPGSDCPGDAFIVISGVELIQDEQGTTGLRNVTVNDIVIAPPAPAAPAAGESSQGPRGEYCAAVAVNRPNQDPGRYLDLLLGQNTGPEWGFAHAVPAYERPDGAKTCDLYGWHTTGQTDGIYPLVVRD